MNVEALSLRGINPLEMLAQQEEQLRAEEEQYAREQAMREEMQGRLLAEQGKWQPDAPPELMMMQANPQGQQGGINAPDVPQAGYQTPSYSDALRASGGGFGDSLVSGLGDGLIDKGVDWATDKAGDWLSGILGSGGGAAATGAPGLGAGVLAPAAPAISAGAGAAAGAGLGATGAGSVAAGTVGTGIGTVGTGLGTAGFGQGAGVLAPSTGAGAGISAGLGATGIGLLAAAVMAYQAKNVNMKTQFGIGDAPRGYKATEVNTDGTPYNSGGAGNYAYVSEPFASGLPIYGKYLRSDQEQTDGLINQFRDLDAELTAQAKEQGLNVNLSPEAFKDIDFGIDMKARKYDEEKVAQEIAQQLDQFKQTWWDEVNRQNTVN